MRIKRKDLVLSIFLIISIICFSCNQNHEISQDVEIDTVADTIHINSKAAGLVSAIYVKKGDTVKLDDVLLRIDNTAIIRRLEMLERERNEFELIPKNRRSQMQESELQIVLQQIILTEKQLDNLNIFSQCKGIIIDILVKESEFVTVGKELIIMKIHE